MNLLDLILVLLLVFFCVIGFIVGFIRVFGYFLSILIATALARFLSPYLFGIVKPFFAAEETYGQITSFIALFTLFATVIQLVTLHIYESYFSEQASVFNFAGMIFSFFAGIFLVGFLVIVLNAFQKTCDKTVGKCPAMVTTVDNQADNSFISSMLGSLTKNFLGLFV